MSTQGLAQRFTQLDPAREDASVVEIPETLPQYIGGGLVQIEAEQLESVNPATGERLYKLPVAGADVVADAVRAAREAAPGWAATPGIERGKVLYRIARRISEQARMLAVAETLDGGKPIRETRDIDVPLAAQHFFSTAGWADKLDLAGVGPDPRALGVAGQVIPWNFPLLMAAWKIAPALAAGNTVVLKAAETTSLSAHLLARICIDAGVPEGVINIVTGDGRTGRLIVEHPGIDKVAFTGSTEVGRSIAKALAGTGRRVTLELGGKGANIVCGDADLDGAVEGIVAGIFFNQGHVCCAGSRLLVQESIAEELLERLAVRVGRIRVGDPLDKNTEMGAINSSEQLGRIERLVHIAREEGARALETGCSVPGTGLYHPPTVLTGVAPGSTIAQQEVFGPVLAVSTFRTEEEGIAMANNTRYGLAAGVWTQNPDKMAKMAAGLQAGVIWQNTYNVFDPTVAFGGFKESGYGREGGRAGIEAYVGH